MVRRLRHLGVGGVIVALSVASAAAVTPQRRQLLDPAGLVRGTARGISIQDPPGLELAPRIREIPLQPAEGNPQPFVWCQAADSRGRLYVGTGNEGRVFRVTPAGGIETFFQAEEIEVTAMAIDPDDNLFVAAAPPGRIYRVAPDGSSVQFFESDERYIWALARTADGHLYAATGDRGILYRFSPAGDAEVILDSDDPHIVSLIADGGNRLYAGTAGRGLVYRITDEPIDIVLETGADEVSALALGPDGTLFAGLLATRRPERKRRDDDERDRRRPEDGSLPGLLRLNLQEEMLPGVAAAPADRRDELARRRTIGSRLISIASDGWTTQLWADDREVLYSLATVGRTLFAATGRAGRSTGRDNGSNDADPRADRSDGFGGALHRFTPAGDHSVVARLPETQVSSLLARPAGGLSAATSNLGNLYWVETDRVDSGMFTSVPVDAGLPSRWGRIWWDGEAPPGSRVEFATRTGNSARPDSTWSGWGDAAVESDGYRIDSPAARFLQWRVEIRGPAGGESPQLHEVWLSYQQENAPPVIEHLRVDGPGTRAKPPKVDPGKDPEGVPAAAAASMPPDHGPERSGPAGSRRIEWEADDPNGDQLVFSLDYRSEETGEWSPAATGIRSAPFDWDTTAIPDGRYRLRLRASDRPDNPPASALTAESVSPALIVDRTPPEISLSGPHGDRNSARIDVTVTDNLSGVADIRYSLDGGPWTPVFPTDGLADSRRESARLPLADLPAGEHSVRVRAKDAGGNLGSGSVEFSFQP
jgi:sugar lactone lactonase YvrE